MTYILDKMSHPGWELKSEHIEHIRWMLEQHVCESCKWTRADYDKYLETHPYDNEIDESLAQDLLKDDINPYNFSDFWPEPDVYAKLSDQEKINKLLDTACGCEFDFINSEEPDSGKRFVEIEK